MVDDMLPFNELHIVDLAGRLHPLEAELVRELHTFGHDLVAALGECIFHDLRVIALANEAIFRGHCRLGTTSGGRAAIAVSVQPFIVEHRRVKVSLIIVIIARI